MIDLDISSAMCASSMYIAFRYLVNSDNYNLKMTDTTTIGKLVDLYHSSRSAGESVHLFMESKNGKDSITFSINPSGYPAGKAESWTLGSAQPSSWPGRKTSPPLLRRKKTPSQLRRDQRRRVDFLAKKAATFVCNEVKEESIPNNDDREKANLVEPVDEITLTEFTNECQEVTKYQPSGEGGAH